MLKNILIALIAIAGFSCQKKLAFFQPSHQENFQTHKTPAIPIFLQESELELQASELPIIASNAGFDVFVQQKYDLFDDKKSTDLSPENAKKPLNISKSSNIISDNNAEQTTLKRKKLYPLYNDNLKIGTVFLVIAGILAFFNLTQLVLIFGLASLVFLYLGLKKYYRRKRIKSIFKK